MSFLNNLEFLWDHLPERYRRADVGLFLKRFLSPFCAELDNYDAIFAGFHERINPDTASEEFIKYFLWAFFGWGWFPSWFTLERMRSFYRNVATHYARRGTPQGIIDFLREFGISARVFNRPQFYDEVVLDSDTWTIDGPLLIIVQILPQVGAVPELLSYYDGFILDSGAPVDPALQIERPDIDELLRFQQPLGHHIIIEEKVAA